MIKIGCYESLYLHWGVEGSIVLFSINRLNLLKMKQSSSKWRLNSVAIELHSLDKCAKRWGLAGPSTLIDWSAERKREPVTIEHYFDFLVSPQNIITKQYINLTTRQKLINEWWQFVFMFDGNEAVVQSCAFQVGEAMVILPLEYSTLQPKCWTASDNVAFRAPGIHQGFEICVVNRYSSKSTSESPSNRW